MVRKRKARTYNHKQVALYEGGLVDKEAKEHFRKCKDKTYKTTITLSIFSHRKPTDNYLPDAELVSAVRGRYNHLKRPLDGHEAYVSMYTDIIGCESACNQILGHVRANNSGDEMNLNECLEGEP
jgi:hypothetical protein